jgi:hypothetical protein
VETVTQAISTAVGVVVGTAQALTGNSPPQTSPNSTGSNSGNSDNGSSSSGT